MAAVWFSAMPSCMILTLVACSRPPVNSSRRAMSPGICSTPRDRSHHRAPVTRAVSFPSRRTASYAGMESAVPGPRPSIASCQAVTPYPWSSRCALSRPAVCSASVASGTRSATSCMAPSCSMPVGRPSASRSIRPSAGSGVREVTPARSRAQELAQAPW